MSVRFLHSFAYVIVFPSFFFFSFGIHFIFNRFIIMFLTRTVKLFGKRPLGDIMGPVLSNVEGMVRMPYGCGEQNMVTTRAVSKETIVNNSVPSCTIRPSWTKKQWHNHKENARKEQLREQAVRIDESLMALVKQADDKLKESTTMPQSYEQLRSGLDEQIELAEQFNNENAAGIDDKQLATTLSGHIGSHWMGNSWKLGIRSASAAYPNSRFCAPAKQCPIIHPGGESSKAVPINAIILGARRPQGVPLLLCVRYKGTEVDGTEANKMDKTEANGKWTKDFIRAEIYKRYAALIDKWVLALLTIVLTVLGCFLHISSDLRSFEKALAVLDKKIDETDKKIDQTLAVLDKKIDETGKKIDQTLAAVEKKIDETDKKIAEALASMKKTR